MKRESLEEINRPAADKREPSVLEDIRNSFLHHLFERGASCNAKSRDDLCYNAKQRLLSNLHKCLKPGKDRAKGHNLHDFADWVTESGLSALREEYGKPELMRRGRRSDEAVIRLFSQLVGFSLMRVDMLYRQIYYTDILHSAVKGNILDFVMQNVLVPIDQGSVGVASRKGWNLLANSFSDPHGTVAIDDLIQGNVTIMMAGLGRQPQEVKKQQIVTPGPRWMLDNSGNWNDSLKSGQEYCAAIVCCYFPLAGVFSGRQKPLDDHLYRLFDHVCRNYERSILRELDYYQAQFVSASTKQVLEQQKDAATQFDTLDTFSPLEKPNNPTGSLLALHTGQRDLRVSIPIMETCFAAKVENAVLRDDAALREKKRSDANSDVENDGKNDVTGISAIPTGLVASKEGGQRLVTEEDDAARFLVLIEPRYIIDFHPGISNSLVKDDSRGLDNRQDHRAHMLRPFIRLGLHITGEVGRDLIENIKLSPQNALYQFFDDIYTQHFLPWHDYFLNLNCPNGEAYPASKVLFTDGKIVVDACEQIVGAMTQVMSRSSDDCDLDKIAADVWRSIRLTYRHLDMQDPHYDEISIRVVLKNLHASATPLGDHLLGVSAFYWTPYHLEPENKTSPFGTTPSEEKGNVVASPKQTIHETSETITGCEVAARHNDTAIIREINAKWVAKSSSGVAFRKILRRILVKAFLTVSPQKGNIAPVMMDIDLKEANNESLCVEFVTCNASTNASATQMTNMVFNLKRLDKTIATTSWRLDPKKYRLAKLSLNPHKIQKWLNAEIDWNNLDNDPLISYLCGVFEAESQPIPPGVNNPRFKLYSYRGCWTERGWELVSSMEGYEKQLAEREHMAQQAEWKDLVSGLTHHIGNALTPISFYAQLAPSALQANISECVGSLSRWTESLLTVANKERLKRYDHADYPLGDYVVKRALRDAVLKFIGQLSEGQAARWNWSNANQAQTTAQRLAHEPYVGSIEICRLLLNERLVFESDEVAENRKLPLADLLYGIVLEMVLNGLRAASEADWHNEIAVKVQRKGDGDFISIRNTANRESAIRFLGAGTGNPGHARGGVGVDFIDVLLGRLGLPTLEKRIESIITDADGDDTNDCWVRIVMSLPFGWPEEMNLQ
jgi:hypothetical protein